MGRKFLLCFSLILVGCTHYGTKIERGIIVARGEALREITADSMDAFYRGAFENCRALTATGFQLVEAPRWEGTAKSREVDGLVRCSGPVDPTLAERYGSQGSEETFAITKGPLPDRYYFKITVPRAAE